MIFREIYAKAIEKNIKFFYHNLLHFYELIKNIPNRNYFIKNDNIFDKNNRPLYKTSITQDSKTLSFYPTHNPLWEKEFFQTRLQEWEEKFFLTGKTINNIIKKVKDKKEFFRKNKIPPKIRGYVLKENLCDTLSMEMSTDALKNGKN